ncbi:hypothetical protein [Pseudoscardovia radai]
MAENGLKIVENEVSLLIDHFSGIKDTMSISNGEGSDIMTTRETIGNSEICDSLDSFNHALSDKKNKYEYQTGKYIEFLRTVKSSSDELDSELRDGIEQALNP